MPTQNKSKSEEEPEKESKSVSKDDKSSKETVKGTPTEKEETSGQLFFSTDGSEPEPPKENPFPDEPSEKQGSGSSESGGASEPSGQKNPGRNPNAKRKPNEQAGPGGNQNSPGKKQNWQDKKRPKNRQRQKFKKPKKLPYEETELKALEIGNLLENESLKTLEGILAIAEEFNSTDSDFISLDDLLALNLNDLKESVGNLDLEIDLPVAPLREEIIDMVLDACLEKKRAVSMQESFR